MKQLTANLVGSVQRKKLSGREYLVAPASIIVEGVLHGSKGPLFYPNSEIKRNVGDWDTTPITNGHPMLNGRHVSARAKGVKWLGFLANTKFNNKLITETWFDVETCNNVDSRIIPAVENGTLLELSTGLFTEDEDAPAGAAHNGRSYKYIARNYTPDHLAILMDTKGACSIMDGCGVNVNADKNTKNESFRDYQEQARRLLIKKYGINGMDGTGIYVDDINSKEVIFAKESKYYSIRYSTKNDTIDALVGEPVEVVRATKYVPVSNAAKKEEGVWRTIRGARVFIEGGKVTKGPKALVGKSEGEAKGSKKGISGGRSKTSRFADKEADLKEYKKLSAKFDFAVKSPFAFLGTTQKYDSLLSQKSTDFKEIRDKASKEAKLIQKKMDAISKRAGFDKIEKALSEDFELALTKIVGRVAPKGKRKSISIQDSINQHTYSKQDFARHGVDIDDVVDFLQTMQRITINQEDDVVDALGIDVANEDERVTLLRMVADQMGLKTRKPPEDDEEMLEDEDDGEFGEKDDMEEDMEKDEEILEDEADDGLEDEDDMQDDMEEEEEKPNNPLAAYMKEKGGKKEDELEDDEEEEDCPHCKKKKQAKLLQNKETLNSDNQEVNTMTELVDFIVANCDCWSDEDRETLNGFSEAKLKKLKNHIEESKEHRAVYEKQLKANECSTMGADKSGKQLIGEEEEEDMEKVKTNTEKKPQTVNEWMEAAPAEIRQVFSDAFAIQKREKDGLIGKIKANKRNPYSDEQLEAMSLNELKPIVQLATTEEVAKPDMAPYFFGQSTPAPTQARNSYKPEGPPPVVWNFGSDN